MNTYNQNISWYFNSKTSIKEAIFRLKNITAIEEITYSKVYVPYIKEPNGTLKLKLYNTDPDNWNLYMFPYDSEKQKRTVKHDELVGSLNSEATFFTHFGVKNFTTDKSVMPTHCEIKMSKSTGLNTLYVFSYMAIPMSEAKFGFEEIILDFTSIDAIRNYFEKEGHRFASNIPDNIEKIWSNSKL